MIDPFGRNINKLRISVGEACNFSCVYCVEDIGGHQISRDPLSVQEMLKLVELLKIHCGIEKVRVTGGEPLVFHPLAELIYGISELGISNIGLTTNGHLLAKRAKTLRKAGLQSVNVSLDSLDPEKFKRLARAGKLPMVLEGIDRALDVGLKVKLNTVVIRGENDDEVVGLLDYAIPRGIEVRYLELMKMGPLFKKDEGSAHLLPDRFFSMEEMLERISTRYPYHPCSAAPDSTAMRFEVPGGFFGIIPNESEPFCATCSRMRLTATGNLVGCLSNPQELSIRDLLEDSNPAEELKARFIRSMSQKRKATFTGSTLAMSSIGG